MESILATLQPCRLTQAVEVWVNDIGTKVLLDEGDIIFYNLHSGKCSTLNFNHIFVSIELLANRSVPLEKISQIQFSELTLDSLAALA